MASYMFPKGFIWGTATSAHQTEGYNTNSDWWLWETTKPAEREFPREASGISCNSYHRFEEDLDLCVELNNNAVRFSLEWARIEPEEGRFNQEEINHYKKVLTEAKERGLRTFVTLHHFTNPIWFSKKKGWVNLNSPKLFSNYAKKCAIELGGLVDVFLTINEPQVYSLQSYVRGIWPPNKKNLLLSLIVQLNMIRAHRKAYNEIKSADKSYQVGIVKDIVWYETDPYKKPSFVDKFAVYVLNFAGRDFFLKPIVKKLDLIGLNYYFTNRIKGLKIKNPTDYGSDLDWWINPFGLEEILVDLKRYNIPIYITENGLADSDDRLRIHFIKNHLIACAEAIKKGVDLKGYFHWSLIDNYEWHHGFWPRFGLVEIERSNNLKRTPRKSFYYYAQICQNNEVIE